jgi:hypothetical protein
MAIAHFLSTSDGMLALYRGVPGLLSRAFSSGMGFTPVLDFVSGAPTFRAWNQLGSRRSCATPGFFSIGELWDVFLSWSQPRLLKLHYFLATKLLPCRIRNHSAVLQNTESRSFHEDFSIRGSPRSKLGSVTKTGSARWASSSTATLRTITCSDSSQHIRHQRHGNNLVRDDNRPNQAQPVGRHSPYLPPLARPQPPVHPGPRYPSSPNSTREYYSSSVPLENGLKRRPHPARRESSVGHDSPPTYRPQGRCPVLLRLYGAR